MLQGDVHRLFLQLRRHSPTPPPGPIQALDLPRSIRAYYSQIPLEERRLLLAWAKKEESGIGLIPAALSGIPVIGFIFAPLIQAPFKEAAAWVWLTFWALCAVALVTGIYIHFRQKAYTTLHIVILQELCDQKVP